jgi:hypothetical protein
MSSESSAFNIATALLGDLQPANFSLQHNGSVFQAAPVAAAEGTTKNFRITELGAMFIANASADALFVRGVDADNAAPTVNPIGVAGIHRAALPTYDDGDVAYFHFSSAGRLLTELPPDAATQTTLDALLTAFNAEDFASETTLAALNAAFGAEDFASETTLAALRTDFNAEDFATQTTLAALGVDFAAYRVDFSAEDFASETTLAALNTAFGAEDFATQTTLAALATDFSNYRTDFTNEDFASETTLSALNVAFAAEDFATQATLAQVLTAVQLIDDIVNVDRARVELVPKAVQTVKSAQLTVGTSAVRITTDAAAPDADRSYLDFMPDPDSAARFFWGPTGVTTATGKEIFPAQTVVRENDANDYFIISDTAGQTFHVVEVE